MIQSKLIQYDMNHALLEISRRRMTIHTYDAEFSDRVLGIATVRVL